MTPAEAKEYLNLLVSTLRPDLPSFQWLRRADLHVVGDDQPRPPRADGFECRLGRNRGARRLRHGGEDVSLTIASDAQCGRRRHCPERSYRTPLAMATADCTQDLSVSVSPDSQALSTHLQPFARLRRLLW